MTELEKLIAAMAKFECQQHEQSHYAMATQCRQFRVALQENTPAAVLFFATMKEAMQ